MSIVKVVCGISSRCVLLSNDGSVLSSVYLSRELL